MAPAARRPHARTARADAAVAGRPGAAAAAARPACSTRGVPVAVRHPVAVGGHRDGLQRTVGGRDVSIEYEPGESAHRPVRRQLQLARAGLVPGQRAARRHAAHATAGTSATTFTVELPDRLGRPAAPWTRSRDAARRPADRAVPARDADGRPTAQRSDGQSHRPAVAGAPDFSEYFHGDTGAGLGATHQTGWTALVAHLISAPPAATTCTPSASSGSVISANRRTHRRNARPGGLIMSLEGKVAIVTGGNSGIGKADRRWRWPRQGANIVIDYVATPGGAPRSWRSGRRRSATRRSASRPTSARSRTCRGWSTPAVKAFGRLDIMVNNAGVETRTSILDTTEAQYDKVLDDQPQERLLRHPARGQADDRPGRRRPRSSTSPRCTRTGRCPATPPTASPRAACGCSPAPPASSSGRTASASSASVRARSPPRSTPSTMADPAKMKTLDAAIPLGRMAQPEEIAQRRRVPRRRRCGLSTATTIFVDGGIMQGSVGL